jgi:hypothetical protein
VQQALANLKWPNIVEMQSNPTIVAMCEVEKYKVSSCAISFKDACCFHV